MDQVEGAAVDQTADGPCRGGVQRAAHRQGVRRQPGARELLLQGGARLADGDGLCRAGQAAQQQQHLVFATAPAVLGVEHQDAQGPGSHRWGNHRRAPARDKQGRVLRTPVAGRRARG